MWRGNCIVLARCSWKVHRLRRSIHAQIVRNRKRNQPPIYKYTFYVYILRTRVKDLPHNIPNNIVPHVIVARCARVDSYARRFRLRVLRQSLLIVLAAFFLTHALLLNGIWNGLILREGDSTALYDYRYVRVVCALFVRFIEHAAARRPFANQNAPSTGKVFEPHTNTA